MAFTIGNAIALPLLSRDVFFQKVIFYLANFFSLFQVVADW
jgi:hypothetical protein